MNKNEKKFKHLTLDDRIEIMECLYKGMSFKAIAKRIAKDPSTVSKEVKLHARRMPMEQTQQEQFIIRRIGGTTYKVRVAFSETAAETMEEKILRMIRNEGVTNDGTCGIMEAPQMSRQSERSAECA